MKGLKENLRILLKTFLVEGNSVRPLDYVFGKHSLGIVCFNGMSHARKMSKERKTKAFCDHNKVSFTATMH